jgi:uncharacterized damage-inducible protein DinB
MVDVKDLFGYNWFSRREFLKSMAEIPWETIIENRSVSFDCIRNIFVHSLQAEYSWISFLRGKSTEEVSEIPFTNFADVNAIRDYAYEVEAETNEYLKTLQEELLEVLAPPFDPGSIVQYTVEDVLMHVVEEEIHHRGELLCIYWQLGIRPPYTSYFAYKRQTLS